MPKPSNAEIVNSYDFLMRRARRLQAARGRLPNFVAVDFYATGDLMRVVQELNGIRR
jgi:thymidylate synthase ThyX